MVIMGAEIAVAPPITIFIRPMALRPALSVRTRNTMCCCGLMRNVMLLRGLMRSRTGLPCNWGAAAACEL